MKYLRQVQGLWYAYWHGSTIRNLEIGLNLVTDLSFAFEAGFVESITSIKNRFLTRIKLNFNYENLIKLPAIPNQDPDSGMYDIDLILDNKRQYVLEQNTDYEILVQYEDHYDYDNWYAFESFTEINSVPAAEPHAYIRFFNTHTVQQIETGDDLFVYFYDGSGSYVITINGRDYIIPDEDLVSLSVGQYVTKWQEFTDDIKVYDYKNYPKWWENLLGYRRAESFFKRYGRINFDSDLVFDSGINLDSFYEHGILDLFYYHTFLVELSNKAVPSSSEDVKIIRSFLDTIKPSYSHYIIKCNIDFLDDITTRQAHFCIESIFNFKSIQGPNQRLDDDWIRESCDSEYGFDNYNDWERFFIGKIPNDGINLLSDIKIHSAFFDSIEGASLDSGKLLDTDSSKIQISRHRYIDQGEAVDNGVANSLYFLYEIDAGGAAWSELIYDGGDSGEIVVILLNAGGADAVYEAEVNSEMTDESSIDGGDSLWP